jgi:hypothetical protein
LLDYHAEIVMGFINISTIGNVQIDNDEVRRIAYIKWKNAGRPEGKDWHFWFRAETEYVRRWNGLDWGGLFKAGDHFYAEETDGIVWKIPEPPEYPPPWFLGTVTIEGARSELWGYFKEAVKHAKQLEPASVPIISVEVGGPSWLGGEIKIPGDPDDKGTIFQEVGHSFFEASTFHTSRGGGRNDLWGDAFCDAFRYCLEVEYLEGSRWLKEMPTKRGGRYEYPARVILRRTGSWDFLGLKALWHGLLARYDGSGDFLDREFDYRMPEPRDGN